MPIRVQAGEHFTILYFTLQHFIMTKEEIKSFYRDIADVCLKHKMSGICGVWFSGQGHDEFGQMLYWDVGETRMKQVVEHIAEKYEYWAKHSLGAIPRPIGRIHEARGGEGDTKNN